MDLVDRKVDRRDFRRVSLVDHKEKVVRRDYHMDFVAADHQIRHHNFDNYKSGFGASLGRRSNLVDYMHMVDPYTYLDRNMVETLDSLLVSFLLVLSQLGLLSVLYHQGIILSWD